MSFALASKKWKYLGINLTTCVQDLHEENGKTLMKEIKDMKKRRAIPGT